VSLPSDKYPSLATKLQYFDRLEAQLSKMPGIEAESLASTLPVNSGSARVLEIEGKENAPGGGVSVQFLAVGPDYFRVAGASVISGRAFSDGDQMTTLPVALVNQRFAERFWPGEQALGKRVRAVDRNGPDEWRAVVGVVPNIMQGDATRQHFQPLVYVPFRQEPGARAVNSDGAVFSGGPFLLRTAVPPDEVAPAVRTELQKLDSDVTLEEFSTLKKSFAFRRDRMDLQHAEMGKHAAVAPIFAMMALLLAALGLYAVIAHSISQRTKEIGVRMALGAAAKDIRRMVFRDGMAPVAVGIVLGMAASLAANRILQSQLVGVSPHDPVTMAGAPAILILIALFACQIPARRAMLVDPAVALRHD
jgi:putative ABC transport system permease protein